MDIVMNVNKDIMLIWDYVMKLHLIVIIMRKG